MAINVYTSKGPVLFAAIYKAIDDKHVVTWDYTVVDGVKYLTHTPNQWNKQAWLKGSAQAGGLVFNIVPPKGQNLSTEVYAVYHGRFIEMLLAHFDKEFSSADATALPTAGDQIQGT